MSGDLWDFLVDVPSEGYVVESSYCTSEKHKHEPATEQQNDLRGRQKLLIYLLKSENIVSDKMGFLAIFALVVSSQIGSGIFMLPISLAPYGMYSPISSIISGFGAISLALVFALLCAKFPRTGGPHVYVKHAFGSTVAFFVGWTYWISSWISSTAVTIASVGYLAPLFHDNIQNIRLLLEMALVLAIMLINLRGILAHSTLLALWCFIGLESATASAGSVDNPAKTIPRAIVLGTICVAIIYFINNFAIMGLISGSELADSRAPYVDAVKIMFPDWLWSFMLPISIAPYGIYSLISWLISGAGAVSLALVFATLCTKFPETGGPHVYVKHAFGPTVAFFVGWTYWLISWVSTTALVIVGVGYLTPLFYKDIQNIRLLLELLLLAIITNCNLRQVPVFIGHAIAAHVEFNQHITEEQAREILSKAENNGILVHDRREDGEYTTQIDVVQEDAVYISRIRQDNTVRHGLNMWIVADNLRKGAALNIVQILEILTKEYL
ncbi:unnamed protein product [Ceratitis capitata]|uniref:(Mediterranean fruit fly) hypothetical protein n=1 Tax=Ceratitis capitata TaxID=7213 RepID=A0A811UCM7_CERCA|nr:unnamed protein product [Ceratitis capitata]